jgi:hypothetical protein
MEGRERPDPSLQISASASGFGLVDQSFLDTDATEATAAR